MLFQDSSLKVFIPCRLNSSRLPSKVLLPLSGMSILEHVYKRVISAFSSSQVFIVTCDDEIVRVSHSFGAKTILTSNLHLSGTSRVREAISQQPCEFALIVQADEPLLSPSLLLDFASHCINASDFKFSNVITPLLAASDLDNLSIVKSVHNIQNLLFLFRNNPFSSNFNSLSSFVKKVCGVYCYSASLLDRIFLLPQSPFSLCESIEQLHLLEHSVPLNFFEVDYMYPDVNTYSDYQHVEHLLSTDSTQRTIFSSYS